LLLAITVNPALFAALAAALAFQAAPPPHAAAGWTPTPAAELRLEEALAELDRQAPALAAARARADEAASLSRQAAAALLPTLQASGGYTRNSDEMVLHLGALKAIPQLANAPLPDSTYLQPGEVWSGTLSLRLPLVAPSAWYDAAAARHGARGASAQAEASRLSLRTTLAGLAQLGRAAEELAAASERAAANAGQLAESARRRQEAGTATPLDHLRARTEEVRRQGELVRVRAELDRLRRAAGTLLGREVPVRLLVADDPEAGLAAPSAEAPLVEQALVRRTEVAAATAQVAAAESQVGSAWARLAPQLSVSGAAFAADVPYPTGKKDGWRATLDLTWSLYDGGFRYGKRREAEARLAGAQATAQAQRLAVSQEVRDALHDVEVARERLRLAREQRRLAEEADATAQRGYQAGVASSLDVIDADDRLYLAEAGLAEARARLAMARVALERASGLGP